MVRQPTSVLEYILRIKKLEIANCEAISLSKLFEKELDDWNARMEEKEKRKRRRR